MALDRPFDDGAGDAAAEQHPQRRGPDAEAAAARAKDAEPRSRAEYFEALYYKAGGAANDGSGPPTGNHRQPDGGADHRPGTEADRPGTETGPTGWDAVDARERPPSDAIHLSPERAAHILDGDSASNGGGHRHGTGKPGKTEFPADWDDQKVIDTVLDVARRPDQRPTRQEWNGRWSARGTREEVETVVVLAGDGRIWTAWPLPGGAGVVKNPEEN